MSLRHRQLLALALTANALRPLRRVGAGVPAFVAGWMTSELAPQLLATTALDAAAELTLRRGRRGRTDRAGLALAAVTAAGLGLMVRESLSAARRIESTLDDGLGTDYLDVLDEPPTREDLRLHLRELAHPFRLDDPGVEVVRDVSYVPGVEARRARLDVHRPVGVDLDRAPVLVQVHGGAWTLGSKETQGLLLMNRMARRGWVCVAVNYRLAPKHPFPAQVVDVKHALAWVREHIGEYGGDPDYLVLTGGSAGGHLASLAALTPHETQWQPGFEDADTSVAACVPFYGVYDVGGLTGDRPAVAMRDKFLGPKVFQRDPAEDHEIFEQASPLARVTPEAPDFFVLHGDADTLVDVRQARAFVARLREVSRASVTYAELPGAHHAFEVFSSIRSQHTVRAVERWLLHHRAVWSRERTEQGPGTTSASA
ncbi:alpha/beta hydrolase [Nocardioides aurantiacus]|uniref:Acetyl esterase/lipase n=1 Tax=Nocardioides aurantiacus TaxID=86796 RepID=A0A3N2CUQ0_9ACTN|nr:alpha/beta hydrolase [Nocardioides aurantiacus]ROR91272.1 acetyl esterase/lipase [Nocardioides aurantiacus]